MDGSADDVHVDGRFLCVCSGSSVCAGVAGDAEQGRSAAAGRRALDGALREGHGSAGSGRSTHRHMTGLTGCKQEASSLYVITCEVISTSVLPV